ncbi:MAG: hypothetical protein H0T89_13160 [Deltaproteobacteria bacterium]|nr:hypothetical protein [Deltaproteobacteria bacterium]MDQ3295769.1 hypothetical protein [Myxococcota bacterium]
MSSISSRLLVSFIALAASACGGEGGSTAPDATVFQDAPPPPPGLTGLGQKCVPAMMGADCPANADVCVSVTAGGAGFCTPLCVANGSGMTNAQGQFTTVTPAPNTATCTGAYTGTVGMAACLALLSYTPMDMPLMASKNYTGINIACVIRCGAGNTCDTGLTCNTTFGACLPN